MSFLDQRWSYSESEQLGVIETRQDVEPILERNKRMMNSGEDGYTQDRDRWLKRVASIPLVIVHQLYRKGINIFDENDWPTIAALLDDPEWRYFRTAPGRISKRMPREHFSMHVRQSSRRTCVTMRA